MSKVQAIVRLLRNRGPERQVSLRWLLHTGSRFDKEFALAKKHQVYPYGDFTRIEIDNQQFLWPRQAPLEPLLQILSELLTPDHPHQYLYGPTQLNANDVVLDIGASEGSFSVIAASRCKQVIAVEPSHTMQTLIRSLFDLRNLPQPILVPCLLGSQPGSAYFLETPENPGAAHISDVSVSDTYEVAVRTLDDVVDSLELKPTFIKCDAEGAEQAILAGGIRFLQTCKPKLAITTYHNSDDYPRLYALLTSIGYRVMGKGFLFSHNALHVQMLHAW
jgi:FkbM family methyltransferase